MQIANIYQGASLNDQVNALMRNLNAVNNELSRKVSKEIIIAVAELLRHEAEKRAPIDTGALEASIKISTAYGFLVGGHSGYRGTVYVSSGSKAGKYAGYMHEWFYNLGPKSRDKQSGQSEIVGRKYLERAYNESLYKIETEVVSRLREFFR